MPPRPSHLRWRPLALLLLAAVAALVALWLGERSDRQQQVMGTLAIAGLGTTLGVVWLTLFSGLGRRVRLTAVAALGLLGAVAAATLEMRGVSGDLLPVVAWRWSSPAPPLSLPSAGSGAGFPAGEFPQFLGPRRNATVPGVALARDWHAQPPRLRWRRPLGAGWSGFAVSRGVAVTLELRGDEEVVAAFRLSSGEPLWSHAERGAFRDALSGDGPRATPAIVGERVFALGATGTLTALELQSGTLLWRREVLADADATAPPYGVASSPLPFEGLLVVLAGGTDGRSLVAYRQEDGGIAWSGGDAAAEYSSPLLASLAGRRQILTFDRSGLVGHDAASGVVLWSHPWPRGTERASQPIPLPGDRVFLSSGYGIGCKLFRVAPRGEGVLEPRLLWETGALKAKFTNPVVLGEVIYGLDDGTLAAVDLATGERLWKRGRFGHGHLLHVGDLLLVQGERGEVALVDPGPGGYRELGRFQAVRGKSWATPALAGQMLIVRSATEAAGWELALATGPEATLGEPETSAAR